ncbi:CLN3 protein, partial [Oesophagostomum dentatum]
MSLVGVCFASLGSGIGEVSCLALSSHYPTLAIAAWSSGTGAAGLFGSFVYAFLTDRSMANLRPKIALLIMLCVPLVYFLTYFFILVVPKDIHRPGWNPLTWIVPEEEVGKLGHHHHLSWDELSEVANKVSFKPLLHLMVPLTVVYFAEYLINQGVNPMVIFNCKEGFNLTLSAQYRWYQVLYQLGVFLSRSSVKVFALPTWSLYLLPVLQCINFFFFFFEALYWFVPNIAIIFVIIVFEGLLGGGSYVNTFDKIHKKVSNLQVAASHQI